MDVEEAPEEILQREKNHENKSAPGDLVVISSPEDELSTLPALLHTFPASFPAPIVVGQQLGEESATTLGQIAQQNYPLPVDVLQTGNHLLLRSGRIYLVPVHLSLTFAQGRVEAGEARPQQSISAIDAFLTEAARAYEDHVTALILHSASIDGEVGAIEIKNAGGVVITQESPVDAMSATASPAVLLPPTIVDFTIPREQTGLFIQNLLNEMNPPQLQDRYTEEHPTEGLQEILEIVSRKASIDFRPYKTSTILRRISHRMAVTHCQSLRDYIDFLQMYPEEVGKLVKAFLINVTQFFRDAEAFSYLKSELLSKLIVRARQRDRVLRFWTAGCATGEEPYSLAMLITDLLGAELPEWSVKIFATDLDEAAIAFARRGIYSENLLKGMPREYRDRFFERVEQGYRISKTLRQMVIFGQQDLSRSAPFPRIDLVLCRNVLIYFTPELQDYVLNQFAFSLSPDGYLFLGKAETVRPTQTFYELVNKHWKVYRCIGNALPSIRRQTFSEVSTPILEGRLIHRQARTIGKSSTDQEPTPPGLELGQLRRFNELLLRFLPVGVVVIDRAYRIITANGSARRLLGLHEITNEQDFLHTVRGIPYHETRNAIDAVFRERNALTLPEVELAMAAGGSGRFVCLACAPMQFETGLPDLVVISVTDVTEQVQIRRQLETIQTEQAQLMQELSSANKRLSDMNKELMDANEELQVANEELVLTHEELQASIEEFETTNEELQAANEELETNNEELQATNEELETTNEELRARTSELQELTSILENEHVRLNEIVEHAPFYILILRGPHLIVETYIENHLASLHSFFNGKTLQSRPLEEVIGFLWGNELGETIIKAAREVYQQDKPRTLSRRLNHQSLITKAADVIEMVWHCTLVPSHDLSNKMQGVILYMAAEENVSSSVKNNQHI